MRPPLAAFCLLVAAPAWAQLAPPPEGELINLAARRMGGRVVNVSSNGSGEGSEDWLIDEQQTDTPYATQAKAPLPQDLVLAFYKDQVATLKSIVLDATSKAEPEARLEDFEVFVSLTSPVAGYVSIGTFTLGPDSKPHDFPLLDFKAKFVKVRLYSNRGGKKTTLNEIAVFGILPKEPEFFVTEIDKKQLTHFKSMGRDALVFPDWHPMEKRMLQDAKDGKFDETKLEEAALIASGVFDEKKRGGYLDQIHRLQEGARKASFGAKSGIEKGALVFAWLHSEFFDEYKSGATDFDKMLDSQLFNCVSSSTLYNVVCLPLGLDMAAIEVPGHVFSLLHADGEAIDAETTSPGGFFRIRDPAQFERFRQLTGLQYVPDPKSRHRREVGSVGLVAIIYFNRALGRLAENDFVSAILCFGKALEMDPGNASALRSLIDAYNAWGLHEGKAKRFEQAAAIFREGLKIDSLNYALDANRTVSFQQWAAALVDAKQWAEAVGVLERGLEQDPGNPYFVDNRVWVYQKWAAERMAEGKPEEALATLEDAAKKTGDAKLATSGKAWALNSWAQKLVAAGEFRKAFDAMTQAVAADPKDKRHRQNRLWVVSQWTHALDQAGKRAEAVAVLEAALELDPKEHSLRQNRAYYCAKAAEELLAKDDLMGAADYFGRAAESDPNDKELQQARVATFNTRAMELSRAGAYERSIAVLNLGISLDQSRGLRQNRAVVYHDWATAAAAKQGTDAGIEILRRARERHPDDVDVEQAWNGFVNRHGIDLYGKEKKAEAALAWFQKAMVLDPKEGSFRNNRNWVFFEMAKECADRKDWAGAIAVMERAAAVDPKEGKFKQNLKYYRAQAEGK